MTCRRARSESSATIARLALPPSTPGAIADNAGPPPLSARGGKGPNMLQQASMAGQRILVTGGGTGLGKGMAEQFLRLGADVAICGRRKSVCDETAAGWREAFPERRVDSFGVDIRVAQAVEEMVEAL